MRDALAGLPTVDATVTLRDGLTMIDAYGLGRRLAEGEVVVDHIYDGLVWCFANRREDCVIVFLSITADVLDMHHRATGVDRAETSRTWHCALKAAHAGARAEVTTP
ncbi:hypothetical protein [Williamsia muralis]|uniref:Uncharacterized protein n=1 Tax=Williamsia marianensis TaxID=85044 RepID=A0ABU4EW47_WILMA|nr:hypothetical protein [Williamsia muralis]MDV7135482.1 hypothetical protein [Williamsia muralis]